MNGGGNQVLLTSLETSLPPPFIRSCLRRQPVIPTGREESFATPFIRSCLWRQPVIPTGREESFAICHTPHFHLIQVRKQP